MIKIAVIGDIIVDKYISGSCHRISPEAPIPIVEYEKTKLVLGGAANVFSNLIGLKVDTLLIGAVGSDKAGKFVTNVCGSEGVLQRNITTTLKTRIVSNNQHIVRIDHEERYRSTIKDVTDTKELLEKFQPDAIIVSDYDKGFVTEAIVNMVKHMDCLLVADPKENPWMFEGFDTITPNEKESNQVMPSRKKVANILVTLGPKGMKLVNKEGEFKIASVAKEVCDVTGAGDTVVATYTYFRCKHLDALSSAHFANVAAGIVVGRFGTSAIWINDLHDILNPIHNTKTVQKAWGKEVWFANSPLYCGKILYLNKGYVCSYHHHEEKNETFYLFSGIVAMIINDKKRILKEGDSVNLEPYDKHNFAGITDSIIIEVSTKHSEDDSIRQDESGKWDEHK